MTTSSLPSMANPLLRVFHLAAISLVLLALLPHTTAATTSTSALPTGARDDAPSAAATGRVLLRAPAFSDRIYAPPTLQSDGGYSALRRLPVAPAVAWGHKDQAATAPSPQTAAPLRLHPAHHARTAARGRYTYTHYGATLADLHCACRPPLCFADSDHDLHMVLYGPRTGGRWHDDSAYGIVRTIEGTPPIMPDSWRAYIYSGGDVCHVEIGYMNNYDSLYGLDCPAWTCERHVTTSADEALAWAISAISTPCGGSTSSAAVAASPPNAIALLPLLAVPFLPPPLAAAVALSSLASLVLAADLSAEELVKVNHATCSVYKYDNATGAIQRARPIDGLRVVCPRPLCIDADSDYDERTLWVAYAQRSHGRRDDPLRVYCTVHSLEGAASPSIFFPWRNTWRTHLPVRVSDIGATASSGNHVCYVELAHMDYREGYYIRCPASVDGNAHVSCMEFPDEPVASAVWEHRSLTYRDTVGPECERYKFSASGQFWGHDYDADL